MATKSFGKLNSAFRENHSCTVFDGDHPKYETNRIAMWTVLTEIDIGNSGDYTPTVRSNNSLHEVQIVSEDDNTPWHPVSLLHQICTNLHWPPPKYELISEEVSGEKHVFTLECKVLQKNAIGMGWSKRKAKYAASKALLEKIKDEENLEKYSNFIGSQISIYNKESEMDCSSEDGNSVNATSELYKICNSHKWPLPVYGLLSVDGPIHNRLFKVGCTMPGLTEFAEGTGRSKREAKHAASLALLDKIMDGIPAKPSSSCSSSVNKQENVSESSKKLEPSKNATSLLHELCMSYNWPLPVYELLPETSSSPSKRFSVGCSVHGHTEIGTGYTKKEAKHSASSALILKIREYLNDFQPFLRCSTVCKEEMKSEYLRDVNISKDPVSLLHELCTSKNWPKPTYKLLLEEDQCSCQKMFTIGCTVSGHTPIVIGKGGTKKKAKHAASQALLDKMNASDGDCNSSLNLHTKNCICDLDQAFQNDEK